MKRRPSAVNYHEVYYSLVDLIYLVKINRIGKHYSARELSFLIGKHKDYVASRESLLPRRDFKFSDIYWLASVFDMQPASMIMDNPRQLDKIMARAFVKKENGVICHTTETVGNNGNDLLLYKLYEYESPSSESEKERDRKQLMELIKVIGRMLNTKFFDKGFLRPLDIFRHCRAVTKKDIRPRLLEKALAAHTATGKFPRLKKIWNKDTGYVYKRITRRKTKKHNP